MTRTLLNSFDEAHGRAIESIVRSPSESKVAILFTDGTALVVYAAASYDCPELEIDSQMSPRDWKDFGQEAAIEAGLVTLAEIEAYEADQRAQAEAYESREFERLKAKYGKPR